MPPLYYILQRDRKNREWEIPRFKSSFSVILRPEDRALGSTESTVSPDFQLLLPKNVTESEKRELIYGRGTRT